MAVLRKRDAMIYTQKQIDRFWSNVDIREPDECWPWKRSKHPGGYGQVGLVVDGNSRVHKAHKVAWEINRDTRLPLWLRARHSCDNRLCCNPHHVVVQPDHITGVDLPRGIHGERHGRAKLTEQQARLIKYRLNLLTTREVADAFNIAYHTVWDIRRNITWRHI